MKSSGNMLRGHLRPMGARSPPFLLIGLFVVLGILSFNYWNLSYEHDAIVKEIAELQDHLRIAVLKKESADKQSEALEKRFREAERQLSKVKITSDHNQRELNELEQKLETSDTQLHNVQSQLTACHSSNSKLNDTLEKLNDLQKKADMLQNEKNDLRKTNQELVDTGQHLRSQVENLRKRVDILSMTRDIHYDPFANIHAQPVSVKQSPGQLGLVKPGTVLVGVKGMNGIEGRPGGPLMLNLPDEEPRAASEREMNGVQHDSNVANEDHVLPPPGSAPENKLSNPSDGNGGIPFSKSINKNDSQNKSDKRDAIQDVLVIKTDTVSNKKVEDGNPINSIIKLNETVNKNQNVNENGDNEQIDVDVNETAQLELTNKMDVNETRHVASKQINTTSTLDQVSTKIILVEEEKIINTTTFSSQLATNIPKDSNTNNEKVNEVKSNFVKFNVTEDNSV